MRFQTLGLLCTTLIFHFTFPHLCHSQTTVTEGPVAVQNEASSLVGTWHYSGGDAGGQQIIDLELRGDGTYTKTLVAIVGGVRYGGTHSGTWTASGMIVYLSGDGNWPPVSHDLSVFTRVVTGWQFIAVTPCRVVDTRLADGALSGPELAAGATRSFSIPKSSCNIPFTATAYSVNVTVVPDAKLNYLSIWPTGQAQPNVSTLNSDGRVKANAAIVPAGSDTASSVSVYATDRTHVILDINGYFAPAGTPSALSFYPLTPCRVADTRNSASDLGGPFLKGGVYRRFPIQSSNCSIPATAEAYSLNFTAVPHGGLNYLTVWPSGGAQPTVSTLNASKGGVTANAAIVPAGNSGALSIFATDDTDLVIDINGYFAPPVSGGLSLYPTTPCRVFDSRQGTQGMLSGAYSVNFKTSSCVPSAAVQAYVVNATVIPTTSLGYLTMWPDGNSQPFVSTLNALDGVIASNMGIVPTKNGAIDVFTSNPTHLVLDLFGYFAP